MSQFRWMFCSVVFAFALTSWGTSSNAALTQQDQRFLASLSTQSMLLEEPSLGETRQQQRIQARLINDLKKPGSKKVDDLQSACIYEGSCFRRRRRIRRFRGRRFRGRRARAWWFIWRGWLTWAPAYGASAIVGIAGLAVMGGNGIVNPPLGAYFGMMLVPVIGPLISFIIAMANMRGLNFWDDFGWFWGGMGALATLVPQVVGFAFLMVGYLSLRRYRRARFYGQGDPNGNKPFWAVTPYVDPNGGGISVFGKF